MKIDGIDILGGPSFPSAPNASNLFYITNNSQGNTPGLYTKIGGSWARILIEGDAVEFDVDDDLDAIGALTGITGILRKTGENTWTLDTKTYLESGQPASIKSVAFTTPPTAPATSGAINIDWTLGNNQVQPEPTGAITYTFTAPTGPCHLQLAVASDGTNAAQNFTWPASVIWYGVQWTAAANKRAMLNFWYDGANYHAMGVNQA